MLRGQLIRNINVLSCCLNGPYEIIVRKLKFYKRLYFKSGFLHDVFWAALLSDRSDDCLRSVFMPLHVAIDSVYSRFYDYVHL